MELKIKKGDIQDALSFTQNIVEKRSTMPILANILLDAKGKMLRVSATDLEVGVSIDCAAEVLSQGRVAVSARELFSIIRELPNKLIHIETLQNNWLALTCERSSFKFVGMTADEFPSLPVNKERVVQVEDGGKVLDMINNTSYAMSSDKTRYNLNGIYLQRLSDKGKEKIRMVATDGHRLSISEKEANGKWKLDRGVIIPKKGVAELRRVLETYEGDMNFRVDDKNITVEKENVELVIRLIDGQFPPYEQVIPKGGNRTASIAKDGFINALRRVSLLASDKTKGVQFSFSPGHLEISTSNPDRGEAREEVDIEYKGETFSVGFNAQYFLDVLNVVEDERVVLELKDDVSPCLIRSEFDKGLLNVIMPMRM